MIEFDLEPFAVSEEPEVTFAVNRELNLAWDIIENTGSNLFLTGRAGTGKTTFLKKLRETGSKRMVVLAPTGVAAINANGTTLHSFFQLPLTPYIPGKGFITADKRFLRVSRMKKRLIASLSLIVIDEISMVRPDTLDGIDSTLRRLRNSSLPFGGVQLLLIGDLRQLPPVVKEDEWEMLKEHYSSPYFFESKALKNAGFRTIELTTVYRQSDKSFINILNRIRSGAIDIKLLDAINQCYRKPGSEEIDEEGYIRLTTHNNKASVINNMRLKELPAAQFSFEAEITGDFPENAYPAEKVLHLKVGAQVMFIKNDTGIERSFYNGLIGIITSIGVNNIHVRVKDGKIIEVGKMEWENLQYEVDEATQKVTQKSLGTFKQFPLQLAWAITIHKSQGLTFDKAIIDVSQSFAPGQTYVALSRCRSLEGLRLESPVPFSAVITDNTLNDFVAFCEENAPDENLVALLKAQYLFFLLAELFDFESIRRTFLDFTRYVNEYVVPLYPHIEKDIKEETERIDNEICGVSKKFLESCRSIPLATVLSSNDSNLSERIKKGCSYFNDRLKETAAFMKSLPKNINNETYATRLNNAFDNLIYLVEFKKTVLNFISSSGFSVGTYLSAKTMAALEREKNEPIKNIPGYTKKKEVKKTESSLSKPPKKQKAEKKPKGYSVFETLNLVRQGKTIPEIIEIRNLKESTITSHIGELILNNQLDIHNFVDERVLNYISENLDKLLELPYSDRLNEINTNASFDPIEPYVYNLAQRYLMSKSKERIK